MNYAPMIRVISSGLVEVLDQPETYRMCKAEVEEAIQNVEANRHKYSAVDFNMRIGLYYYILRLLNDTGRNDNP